MSPPLDAEQAARVERHTGLVRAVARRVSRNVAEQVLSFEELESIGYEALVQAAMRYDPSSPASFATYAHYRVYGKMIDELRKRTPGRRRHERAMARLAASQDLLRQAAEDHAAQRAAGQPMTLAQRVEAARELVRRTAMAVRLADASPDPNTAERIADQQIDPERALVEADERQRLLTLFEELEPHERGLLEGIYVEGKTMKQLATQFGLNVSTISRRHARILDRLNKQIAEDTR
jgi:RNA polymerase sigma factor FliA